jgi:hypothetical protein
MKSNRAGGLPTEARRGSTQTDTKMDKMDKVRRKPEVMQTTQEEKN